jgi:hypothetical protein
MKLNGLFFVLFLVCGVAAAQTPTFENGDKVLNLGIGFGSGLYTGGGYTSHTPALSASIDIDVVDNVIDKGSIGVGGYVGYTSAKYEYGGFNYGWKYTDFVLAARGTFHYPLVEKLDTYAGLALGYDVVTSKETGTFGGTRTSANASGAYFSGFLGGRYYFSDNFAGLIELGSGIAYFNLGVALKL